MGLRIEIQGDVTRIVGRLRNPDLAMLMTRVEALMTEDHTRAVMSGQDKDGNPFTPVTYRNGILAPPKKRNRYNRGVGQAKEDADGNLSPAEYRRLTGPPLAPRGMNSRIITNYATESGRAGDQWFAKSFLVGIVSKSGFAFMESHFKGAGRLPRRDDRGIRPWGRDEIRKAIRAEVRRIIRGGS